VQYRQMPSALMRCPLSTHSGSGERILKRPLSRLLSIAGVVRIPHSRVGSSVFHGRAPLFRSRAGFMTISRDTSHPVRTSAPARNDPRSTILNILIAALALLVLVLASSFVLRTFVRPRSRRRAPGRRREHDPARRAQRLAAPPVRQQA